MVYPKFKIADDDGNVVDVQSNRLDVNVVHPAGMGTLTTYGRFTATHSGTATVLTDLTNGIGVGVTDAKEVIIQSGHGNSGNITVGSIGAVDSTNGIRLDAGDTIILPVSDISDIYIDASAGSQRVFVAIVK